MSNIKLPRPRFRTQFEHFLIFSYFFQIFGHQKNGRYHLYWYTATQINTSKGQILCVSIKSSLRRCVTQNFNQMFQFYFYKVRQSLKWVFALSKSQYLLQGRFTSLIQTDCLLPGSVRFVRTAQAQPPTKVDSIFWTFFKETMLYLTSDCFLNIFNKTLRALGMLKFWWKIQVPIRNK